ncbi:MAG: adenylosuccinate lyase [Candidatus Palauibacterales bacterium]|nr:adenylosuccinate lyase [Candidatus Palauibacterales bacterium]MDP2481800.1 adenylosuccinate lyase [Candidatus Palauibacterales bacterium]
MSATQDRYPHPLIERYASADMADVFSPARQARLWRDLWIALAETERELGVDVPAEAIAAMRAARDEVDLGRVAELERELRHDVMAHVHHFGELAPDARPFIHLGATSCYVTDNAGLIQLRDGLRIVRARLVAAVAALAGFAERWKDLPALGYTHWQPAQPTTVGKRAALWLHDLLLDVEQVDRALGELRFRGARGTTGTEDTFLELLGDGAKVDELNARLASHFGFEGTYDVVGQTYPRKVDHRVLSILAGIGASTAKFGTDVRVLQSFGEIEEPFGSHQIGSSAMPYKRNPMRSERICGLARHLCSLEIDASWTASVQGLERTLDDSANRRISIPEAFLCADSVLQIQANVASGLVVHEAVIAARLARSLPFLAVERILIAGVARGGDRQDLHERLRRHAMEARARMDEGAPDNDFFDRVAGDAAIGLTGADLEALADPSALTGRAPEQVDRLLRGRVDELLASVETDVPGSTDLRV